VVSGLSVETRAGKALACVYSFVPFDGVSVTAVQFRWPSHGNSHINSRSDTTDNVVLEAVIGSEMGDIRMWELATSDDNGNGNGSEISVTGEYTHSIAYTASHGAAVKRMRFGGKMNDMLATCGSDNTVRIFKL